MTTSSNLQTTGKGGAQYVLGIEPAEWLVASIPGAAEAREAWQAENAKGAELSREFSASGRALVKLRNSDPLASELEAAERAHKALDKALDAQAKKSLAALRRFDAIVRSGYDSPEEAKAHAAEHALKKHEEAAAAWEVLKAAVAERDQAHASAGAPGRDWRNSAPVTYRNLASVETVIRPMIGGFDVEALKLAAEGKRVATADEMAEAERAAIEAANAKYAAALRARGAKEAR